MNQDKHYDSPNPKQVKQLLEQVDIWQSVNFGPVHYSLLIKNINK